MPYLTDLEHDRDDRDRAYDLWKESQGDAPEPDLDDYWAFEPDVGPIAPVCPQCDGIGTVLGFLGRRLHLRCRDCGLDYSQRCETCPQQAVA